MAFQLTVDLCFSAKGFISAIEKGIYLQDIKLKYPVIELFKSGFKATVVYILCHPAWDTQKGAGPFLRRYGAQIIKDPMKIIALTKIRIDKTITFIDITGFHLLLASGAIIYHQASSFQDI